MWFNTTQEYKLKIVFTITIVYIMVCEVQLRFKYHPPLVCYTSGKINKSTVSFTLFSY